MLFFASSIELAANAWIGFTGRMKPHTFCSYQSRGGDEQGALVQLEQSDQQNQLFANGECRSK